MGVAITMGIFFIVSTMVFVAIAVFLPEWLGITGKTAQRVIAEQQEVPSDSPSSRTSSEPS